MQTSCNQTGDMCHIDHQVSADLISNLSELGKIDGTRISRRTGNNQFGFMLLCQLHQVVIVNSAGLRIDAIRDDIEILTRDIDLGTMGQMSAFIQVHAQDGITRLEQRKVNGDICLSARMRLDICVFSAEQLTGTFSGDFFHDIDAFTAAVISSSGVTFSVFIGQDTAHSGHDSRGDNIFTGDQFNIAALSGELFLHRGSDFRVSFANEADRIE